MTAKQLDPLDVYENALLQREAWRLVATVECRRFPFDVLDISVDRRAYKLDGLNPVWIPASRIVSLVASMRS